MRVTDKGIGIPSEHAENLFARQNTKTSRGTQGERGTGLGLILCKEMVENNGGKIFVTSTEGKGSTFHVLLKAVARQEKNEHYTATPEVRGS